jgi:undecaprenyl-diphosphatase
VALAVAAALLAVFIGIAAASGAESALSAWDRRVSEAFIAWRTPMRSQVFWAVTLLGDAPVLAALSFSAVLLLATWGRRARAALVAVGMLIGWGLSETAKAIVDRPRPPADDALVALPSSGSLPSGHALTTLVFLGVLVYLAFRRPTTTIGRNTPAGRRRPALAWTVTAAAAVTVGLIGVSRVYLGVHWMTDNFGAWCLGGAWLLALLGGVWTQARRKARTPLGLQEEGHEVPKGSRWREAVRLCGHHPPAGVVTRIVAAAFVVALCVTTYLLTAVADPLLADL